MSANNLKVRVWGHISRSMSPTNPTLIDFCHQLQASGTKGASALQAEVMLSTGLSDRHGQEIFEDDIVFDPRCCDRPHVVERFTGRISGWVLKSADGHKTPLVIKGLPDEPEIMGNRYENPDLMGGEL